jgi:Domain of unknown function (DUF222)
MFDLLLETSWDDAYLDELTEAALSEPADADVSIPAGLAEMAPGPFLAAILSTIDVTTLSGYDRVVVLQARQRMASHSEAATYEATSAIADHYFELDGDFVSADEAAELEIRAALRLTRRSANIRLTLAHDLHHRLPAVGRALAAGDIDVPRSRVLCHETGHLDDDTARRVVDLVIDEAPRLTTGQLGAHLRQVCVEADPDDAKIRYEEALEERRVTREATVSGTTNLFLLDVETDRAAEAFKHIDRLARSLKTKDQKRGMDQIRADVALDLLCGKPSQASSGKGSINIRVDLATLAQLDDNPAELGGYGPVIADIARQVTERQQSSQWKWTLTHPDSGMVLDTGITRRRPNATQQRWVEAENPTCTFPGCRMPAEECDIDHLRPWAEDGPTAVGNLNPDCRHDHVQFTKHGWRHYRLPDGDYLWISPLGHRYTTSGRAPPPDPEE